MRAKIDLRSDPPPRSVVGIDAGLASFACAHVEKRNPAAFQLVRGSVYVPPDVIDAATVAEENAYRAAHLLRWLRPVLGQAVLDGAEVFHAERYEHLRQASAAAKYAAGHAVLVAASALCEPRPHLQHAVAGVLAFVSGRAAKRAATGCDVATKAVVMAAARRLIGGMGEALRGLGLAEYRPHLADAGIVALHALGHREKVLIVGEGGGSAWTGERPISAEERDFLEASLSSKRKSADLSALFDFAPASVGREASFAGRAVVFVGKRAATACGLRGSVEPLTWFEHEAREDAGKRGPPPSAYMAAVLPDLGGRWWSNPKNAAKVKTFLRAAARVS